MTMIFAASCRIERATKWNMRKSVMEYADERAVYCRRLACVMRIVRVEVGNVEATLAYLDLDPESSCNDRVQLVQLRDANVAQRQRPWARRTRAGSLTKTAWPYRTPHNGSPAGTRSVLVPERRSEISAANTSANVLEDQTVWYKGANIGVDALDRILNPPDARASRFPGYPLNTVFGCSCGSWGGWRGVGRIHRKSISHMRSLLTRYWVPLQ